MHTSSMQSDRGLAKTQHTTIIQNPGFRVLGGNLTHRPTVGSDAYSHNHKGFVDITPSIHGSLCTSYKATLAPHRCALHFSFLLRDMHPNIVPNFISVFSYFYLPSYCPPV